MSRGTTSTSQSEAKFLPWLFLSDGLLWLYSTPIVINWKMFECLHALLHSRESVESFSTKKKRQKFEQFLQSKCEKCSRLKIWIFFSKLVLSETDWTRFEFGTKATIKIAVIEKESKILRLLCCYFPLFPLFVNFELYHKCLCLI